MDIPSRTLTWPVSLPVKPRNNPPTESSIPVDKATQTLFSYKDGEVQTDSTPPLDDLKKAYQELASSYNDIHYELEQYKEAYNRLAEKYAQNKAAWKQWSEQENAQLINSKKGRIDRGTTEPQTIGRNFNGYITLATPITGGSPTPRVPNISPVKPRFRPSVIHSSPKKGGLFHEFPGSSPGVVGGVKLSFEPVDENSLIAGDPKEGPEELTSSPLSSPQSSLSIPGTQAPPTTFGVTQNSKPQDGGDSTVSEDEPRSSDHYSGALKEPVLPSWDSAFKVPIIKKEIDVCGRGRKPLHPELETADNISRPGRISGGLRIATTEDTGVTQDTENDLPVLTFPLPTTGEGRPLGIRSDFHLARPTTPVGTARAEPASSPPFSAPNKGSNSTVLPEPASNSTVLPEPSSDSTAPAALASASTVPPEPGSQSTVLSVPPSDPTILSVLTSDFTILPSPPIDSTVLPVLASVSTGIRELQIPLEDIFSNPLPVVLDPKDLIISLYELEAHVIGSLQGTTWSRALQRAKKHMKEKGVLKGRATFSQSKHQECPFCMGNDRLEGKRVQGEVEIHQNGLRYQSPVRNDHRIDVLFSNVKHLFFQPCAYELIAFIHVHLQDPIRVGKKKTNDVQFYRAATDIQFDKTGNRKRKYRYGDEEGFEQEQDERRRRALLDKEFKAFADKISEAKKKLENGIDVVEGFQGKWTGGSSKMPDAFAMLELGESHGGCQPPLLPTDTFSLGAANSIAPEASRASIFLADTSSQASDMITDVVFKLTAKWEKMLTEEAIISACVVGIWIMVLIIAIARTLSLFYTSDKQRGEAGGLPPTPVTQQSASSHAFSRSSKNSNRGGSPASRESMSPADVYYGPTEKVAPDLC
ncbi:hypothetical protein HOY80DRAFT_1081980 [Tuber brumale]|nr:hypothetical protein HOY80DRAFT_1081980 [Tuber brumale]